MRKYLQVVFFALTLFAFASPASAGPVGDLIQEAGEAVSAAEEALGDSRAGQVVEQTTQTVKELIGEVAKNVQAFINAAKELEAEGDTQGATAHALAGQAELRRLNNVLGLGLKPLTGKQLKAKAKKTARFKAARANLPSGLTLVTGECKMPEYGWTCCPSGKTPSNGVCK